MGAARFQDLLSPGGRIYHETHYRPLLQMQDSVREIAFEIVCADGRRLPVLVNATVRRDSVGRTAQVRVVVFDATDRRSYERELLGARRHAERLQRHNALLAETSRLLDVERGVYARARAVVRLLAGGEARAALILLAGEPQPRAVAGTSADEKLLSEVATACMAESEPQLRAGGEGAVPDAIAVPLLIEGRALGALSLSPAVAGEGYGADDVGLLQALGDRTAVALANAQLYEREHAVALALQRAMLSGELPVDPRCEVVTHYSPAVRTLEVGGDWYDAVRVASDRVVLAVGDVVGKGLDAAATMGQLRSAMRALAVAGLPLAEMLAKLDLLVEHTANARGATVAVMELDLSTGALRFACAGHPPPVILAPDAAATLLWGGRAGPLGTRPEGQAREEASLSLLPGTRVLLFSDGLVERREHSMDRGMERLTDAFTRRRSEPLPEILAALAAEMLGEQHGADDICMLAFSYEMPAVFDHAIGPDPAQLTRLRRRLGGWLDEHGVARDEREALVLACSEAAANAIEHGLRDHDGAVHVHAELSPALVTLEVRDDGRWRRPRQGSTRGRGLPIIEHLMDDVKITRKPHTIVRMLRRRGPGR